jgi:hypothetical protein
MLVVEDSVPLIAYPLLLVLLLVHMAVYYACQHLHGYKQCDNNKASLATTQRPRQHMNSRRPVHVSTVLVSHMSAW